MSASKPSAPKPVTAGRTTTKRSRATAAAAPSSVPPTTADGLVALALVDRALAASGLSRADLVAALSTPGVLVTLVCDTEGLAGTLLDLLETGVLLGRPVERIPASRLRLQPGLTEYLSDHGDLSRPEHQVAVLDLSGDLLPSFVLDALARAVRCGLPVLAVGGRDEVPEALRLGANLVLDLGLPDPAIVAAAICHLCGADRAEALAAIRGAGLSVERLVPDDLAAAIRPGLPLPAIVATLAHLAEERAADAEGSTTGSGDKGRGGAAGPARTSTPSKPVVDVILPEPPATGRLLAETLPGMGRARDWAMDLAADLRSWRAGTLAWSQTSSRILLAGPPGTGKTTFARALCNSLDLPLHVTSGAQWLRGSHLGHVLDAMTEAFAAAVAAAPVILFIDEADAIGMRRPIGEPHADYWNTIVNRLLELMDGAVRAEGVVIVGATNRPGHLDPALLRSGRWERQIEIPLPDRAALAAILAHHLGTDLAAVVATAPDEEKEPAAFAPGTDVSTSAPAAAALLPLARLATGLSGADVERLVREGRGAARRAGRTLAWADVEERLRGMRPRLSPELRRGLAVHEAGHAVVAHTLGFGVPARLTIDNGRPFTEIPEEEMVPETSARFERTLAMLLAGRAAEEIVLDEASAASGGSGSSDLARATRLALAMETRCGLGRERPLVFRDGERAEVLLLADSPLARNVAARLDEALVLARQTLLARRTVLDRLTDALLAAGALEDAEIAALLGEAGSA